MKESLNYLQENISCPSVRWLNSSIQPRSNKDNMLCSYVSNPASNLPNLLIPFENILVIAEITTWTIRKLMNLRDCASNCGALEIYLRKLNHKVKKLQRKIYCPEHGPKYAFPPSRIELL